MGQSYGIGLYYLVLNSIRFGLIGCIWLCHVASAAHTQHTPHTVGCLCVGEGCASSYRLYIVSCCDFVAVFGLDFIDERGPHAPTHIHNKYIIKTWIFMYKNI